MIDEESTDKEKDTDKEEPTSVMIFPDLVPSVTRK